MSHKCLHRLCVEMEENDDTSQLLVEEVGDPVAWDDGHQKFKISGILMSQISELGLFERKSRPKFWKLGGRSL
jgi:hypothetical protein